MIIAVDENKLINKLPTFVAADPDLLPSAKLTEGGMQCVLHKLSNISDQLLQMDTIFHDSCQVSPSSIRNAIEESLTKHKLFDNIDEIKFNLIKIRAHMDSFDDNGSHREKNTASRQCDVFHPQASDFAEKSSATMSSLFRTVSYTRKKVTNEVSTGSYATVLSSNLHEVHPNNTRQPVNNAPTAPKRRTIMGDSTTAH